MNYCDDVPANRKTAGEVDRPPDVNRRGIVAVVICNVGISVSPSTDDSASSHQVDFLHDIPRHVARWCFLMAVH